MYLICCDVCKECEFFKCFLCIGFGMLEMEHCRQSCFTQVLMSFVVTLVAITLILLLVFAFTWLPRSTVIQSLTVSSQLQNSVCSSHYYNHYSKYK